MKKRHLLLLSCLLLSAHSWSADADSLETVSGNERLVSYEYWFDEDVAHRQGVPLGTSAAVVSADIDTDHLADGLHHLHLRLHRQDGSYSSVLTEPFMKIRKEKEGHLDYWLDDDLANRQSVPLASSDGLQTLQLDLSDNGRFALGSHRLNMQVAMAGTVLGTVSSQPLQKLASGRGAQIEYWFDDDLAHRGRLMGRAASSGDGLLYVNAIDMSRLQAGLHRLNVRATSADGLTSSSVLSTHVMKLASTNASALEYWVDDDVAGSQLLEGVADSLGYVFTDQLDLSGLSVGMHRLSVRAAGTDGSNLGAVISCNVFKLSTSKVTYLEYWFDDDDRAHSHLFEGGYDNGDSIGYLFASDLNLDGIAPGHHRLHYRAIGTGGATTAIGSTAVVVKTRRSDLDPAVMATYTIAIDDEPPLVVDSLPAQAEAALSRVIGSNYLTRGRHTLKTTFWNSYGASVTDETSFWATGPLRGDVDGDGVVTTADVRCIVSILGGMSSREAQRKAADVNADGRIDIADMLSVLNVMQ